MNILRQLRSNFVCSSGTPCLYALPYGYAFCFPNAIFVIKTMNILRQLRSNFVCSWGTPCLYALPYGASFLSFYCRLMTKPVFSLSTFTLIIVAIRGSPVFPRSHMIVSLKENGLDKMGFLDPTDYWAVPYEGCTSTRSHENMRYMIVSFISRPRVATWNDHSSLLILMFFVIFSLRRWADHSHLIIILDFSLIF